MKKIIYILLILLASCSLTKQTTKNKKDTKKDVTTNRVIKEKSIKTTYRPKDSVIYYPNYQFKDTTIYKRGRTNTIVTRYNSQGQVSQVDCISDAIQEILETFKETLESKKDNTEINGKSKTADTDFKLSPLIILYIYLGLGFLLVVYKKV